METHITRWSSWQSEREQTAQRDKLLTIIKDSDILNPALFYFMPCRNSKWSYATTATKQANQYSTGTNEWTKKQTSEREKNAHNSVEMCCVASCVFVCFLYFGCRLSDFTLAEPFLCWYCDFFFVSVFYLPLRHCVSHMFTSTTIFR